MKNNIGLWEPQYRHSNSDRIFNINTERELYVTQNALIVSKYVLELHKLLLEFNNTIDVSIIKTIFKEENLFLKEINLHKNKIIIYILAIQIPIIMSYILAMVVRLWVV